MKKKNKADQLKIIYTNMERIILPLSINSDLYFVQVDNGIITKTKQIVVY